MRPKDDTATPLEGAAAAGSMLGLAGTKSWTGGITLTSSGLRDLDTILGGGGQPLGTCILIEEDRWTCSLASAIVRYWCAEVSGWMKLVMAVAYTQSVRAPAMYVC